MLFRSRGRAVLLSLLLGSIGVLAAPSSAALAAGASTGTTPFGVITPNPCNGTSVKLAGTLHSVSHFVTSGLGFHVDEQLSAHLSGVGSDGTAYSSSAFERFGLNATKGGEISSPLSELIISHGKSPNFRLHEVVHLTINANGVLTAVVANFTATCSP